MGTEVIRRTKENECVSVLYRDSQPREKAAESTLRIFKGSWHGDPIVSSRPDLSQTTKT